MLVVLVVIVIIGQVAIFINNNPHLSESDLASHIEDKIIEKEHKLLQNIESLRNENNNLKSQSLEQNKTIL